MMPEAPVPARRMQSVSRESKVYRLLGLARRQGAVAPGIDAVRRAIRTGEARLVLFAEDASVAQLDKVRASLRHRSIPRISLGSRDTLGSAVGLAPLSALAVTSASLAEQLVTETQASAPRSTLVGVEG